ncbi:MAG: ABC transporter permease [Chitinophagales bacterium]
MFDFDKWQEIFYTIGKHKLRTALTAFGVFWGIFMLVILLGAGAGLKNGVLQGFDFNKNAVFVWTQRTGIPYKGYKAGRSLQLKNEDIMAVKENIASIEVISPRLQMGALNTTYADKSGAFQINGDYPSFLKVKALLINNGRFVNDNDMDENRKIAVIGGRVKEILFGDEKEAVGEYIEIAGVPFKVVGTFTTKGKGEDAIEDLQSIFLPLTSVQQSFGRGNEIDWFALIPKENVPSVRVETEVKSLLAQRHNVSPDDKRAFGSANLAQEYGEIQTLFAGIRVFSWLVAILTIIAGVVGVGNIMMIIVKERTREIGIRKAIGAHPSSIIGMILQESLVLTSMAGYMGLVLGVLAVEGLNSLLKNFDLESDFFANPEIDFNAAFWAIMVLLVAGTLAGLVPGLKAASVDPVVALRSE